jgi:8-oxo-dGTP diphosphatase
MERISARAIIFTDDSKLVLIHRKWRGEEYWVTPGGGVEIGESLQDALKREIQEEIGIDVTIGDLVLEVAKDVHERHSIQKFFLCQYVSGDIGTGIDTAITNSTPENFSEVVLAGFEDVQQLNIVPEEARELILNMMKTH